MIYFDGACIAKCHLNEPNADKVRALARSSTGLCSCGWARLEFASVLHRWMHDGRLKSGNLRQVVRSFREDERAGVWTWFVLTSDLLALTFERLATLRANLPPRAADALHLTCAKENGLEEICSNDRHLLAGAPHFGLKPIDVLRAP